MKHHTCLFCSASLRHIFVDLGVCPPSNAFLTAEQCEEAEVFHPLRVYVCEKCLLVQSPICKRPQDIYNHDYVYHSSWSSSWVAHAKEYVDATCARFGLGKDSLIVEVGSNDGYLLQHAVARGVPCVGIDPSAGAASIAQTRGIPTITDFFSTALAHKIVSTGKQADLVCGVNVFAHVPDINNFIAGICVLLKPKGVVNLEFQYLLRLVEDVQFDTIYHEHYFYYSLAVVQKMLDAHGLRLFDVDVLPTHGGSLRIYACHSAAHHRTTDAVAATLAKEKTLGMDSLDYYKGFQKRIFTVRNALMSFLLKAVEDGKKVLGYGAAAKGNTIINHFGIRGDLLPFIVDASPAKQGKFLPGSRIPVYAVDRIKKEKPDYLLVLAWNLIDEIMEQHSYIRKWGGKFVTVMPRLRIV